MTEEGRTPSWGASLSWQSLNVFLQVLLQLVYIRILAGLLTEEDFGIMAIALIVVGVVEIFAQVGIGPPWFSLPNSTTSTFHPLGGSAHAWEGFFRGHVHCSP